MSYEFKTKRMEKAVVNDVVNKETVDDIKLYPFIENLQRGITKETCIKFGVRAALSEKDGKTPTAYYFPSYSQKGEIIGYTKQDVTKNKDEKWHWSAVGTVSIGKIYPILCIKQADCCGVWIVDVGGRTNYDMTVCSCGYECKHDNTYLASRFAPLQESVFPSLTMSKVVEKERELISMN